MTTLKFQLLDSKLTIVKNFKTQKDLLIYCDSLDNLGRGMFIHNTITKKSVQLV